MGSVTSPTGTVKRKDLTHLVDAGTYDYSGWTEPQGTSMAQNQYLSLCSDHADVCGRLGSGGSFAASEITLRFVIVNYALLPGSAPVYPPAADLPLTFTANTTQQTSDGVLRTCRPYVNQASSQGNAGTDVAATGGTVTFTRMDAGGMEASWDLWFDGDHTTGSFAAPWCGTPPA